METGQQLGPYKDVQLPQGLIRYREVGQGPPLVFLHGLLVNGDLWRRVAPSLAADYRCILPDLPLGSHRLAMNPGADLSPLGIAGLVAAFLAALDLDEVTLVGNDSGGAICQLVVAHHRQRLAGLVLTNCEAFENFPPLFVRSFVIAARVPGFGQVLGQAMRSRLVQRGLVWLVARQFPEPGVARSYFSPIVEEPGVRRDTITFLRGVTTNQIMLDAAKTFASFHHPVLIAWAPEDKFVGPVTDAHRLHAAFPNAKIELIPGSRAFIPEDQPERLAGVIARFLAAPATVAA